MIEVCANFVYTEKFRIISEKTHAFLVFFAASLENYSEKLVYSSRILSFYYIIFDSVPP